MSGGVKPAKYTYTVSGKTEADVRRIYGKDADEVLTKLRTGIVVGKGPHTFKAAKAAVISKADAQPKQSKGSSTPPKAGDPGAGKDK